MITTIEDVFEQQKRYNDKVMLRQKRPSAEWMETYILGLMSECGQLLEAMRWKRNRLQLVEEFGSNVPEELADITKYVFSMWLLMGFTGEQMLELISQKSLLLESIYTQEFETQLKPKIVVFDLDNVLADTQSALAEYMEREGFPGFDYSTIYRNIHLDLAFNSRFDQYRELKNKFESSGGYSWVEPIFPIRELFFRLHEKGYSIVVWTARPVETFKRIRFDTFRWFSEEGYIPDLLKFGREERITWTANLSAEYRVVMIEDDPGLIKRAKLCDIPIIVPQREYNLEQANFLGNNVGDLVGRISEVLDE
mgnify:CR=1 FL=1